MIFLGDDAHLLHYLPKKAALEVTDIYKYSFSKYFKRFSVRLFLYFHNQLNFHSEI
jgi:hypothetical protein